MRTLLIFACSFGLWIHCSQPSQKDSLPQKVADAYGIEHMDKVVRISYTWNVRRDSATVVSRNWVWDLESGEVKYSDSDTTASYHPSQKTEEHAVIDQRFINDKYWLMFPFQLAWDTGYSYEVVENQHSPIQKLPTTKLTILYNEADGYTPGDAYDLYLDTEHRIKEWVFRRGNGNDGRAITWENVQDYQGLKLTLDHRNDAGEKFLWFSDVDVRFK